MKGIFFPTIRIRQGRVQDDQDLFNPSDSGREATVRCGLAT